ncbi:Formin FH2 domain [Trinorchestia longiramus]|nr:Formin FH2 domain [Trinorchestia longiramus]
MSGYPAVPAGDIDPTDGPPQTDGANHTDGDSDCGSVGAPIPPAPPTLGSYGHLLAPKPGHQFGLGLVPILKPKKTKKTIKLFWNEVQKDPQRQVGVSTLWDEVRPVDLDHIRLEHLFESRAKDVNAKKLLSTMLPSAEEKQKIQEAAIANPEVPLGSAEQFLMMLSTISELPARLKLWLFKLDYEVMEKEVAEPLMDLKQGIEQLQKNHTFKVLLSLLLSVGNFLNNSDARGFQIAYLSKVPEVKDTVYKHSLLHHLCHMVLDKFPDTTDLYSEIGAITRASKVDFEELSSNIEKMEVECKASWDYLKVIAKHDGPTNIKLKMSEFLADSAERIIVLGIIYRRVMRRFQKFMTYLGAPVHQAKEAKAQEVCSIVSEFALEYRTCRERVQQQLLKKANHRERNKTRGKMITENGLEEPERSKSGSKLHRMEKFRPKPRTKEEKADRDLRQLLAESGGADSIRGKNTWRRTKDGKQQRSSRGEDAMTDLLLGALGHSTETGDVRDTLTGSPQLTSRSRELENECSSKNWKPSTQPANSSNRQLLLCVQHERATTLRRTLKNGLTDEERKLLATIAAQTR